MSKTVKETNTITKYKSKLGVVMVFVPILVLAIPVLFEGTIETLDFVSFMFVVLILAFGYFTMVYEVYPLSGTLVLKVGFVFSKKVVIKDIIKIEETNSIMSGHAFSLDRLEIFYDRYDSVLVSPKNKEQFIKDLVTLNPNIVYKPKK